MTFKLDARTRATAEAQSAELGRLARRLDEASWALDAGLSAYDKDAAGYRRANRANPDGGENFDPADLDEAIRNARAILASCNPIQDLISRRAAHAAEAARVALAADPTWTPASSYEAGAVVRAPRSAWAPLAWLFGGNN